MLRNAVVGSGGGVIFPGKKRYKGLRFNVIIIMTGWGDVKFPGKKRYVTLDWSPERENRPGFIAFSSPV